MNDKLIEIAKELITKPSVTPNDAGCLEFIANYLKNLGFHIEIIEFHEEGHESVKNLYAKYGDTGKHLAFAGHVDVVPTGDEVNWLYPPFSATIADDKLYGRGAVDMKGTIAASMHAVTRAIDTISSGTISFIITADEEGIAINGTKKLMQYLADKGEKFDYCIIGEPTCVSKLGDTVKNGAKGSANFKLQSNGIQGHVAFPDHNKNPVDDIAKAIINIANYDWNMNSTNKKFSTTNLEFTNLDTSSKACNVVPKRAIAEFNVRYNDNWTAESIHQRIKKICNDNLANYDLQLLDVNPCFHTTTSHNTNILNSIITEITGIEARLSTDGATSDARFIKDYCEVVEFGALGATAHQIDEHIPIKHLEQLENIYYLFIQKFLST